MVEGQLNRQFILLGGVKGVGQGDLYLVRNRPSHLCYCQQQEQQSHLVINFHQTRNIIPRGSCPTDEDKRGMVILCLTAFDFRVNNLNNGGLE